MRAGRLVAKSGLVLQGGAVMAVDARHVGRVGEDGGTDSPLAWLLLRNGVLLHLRDGELVCVIRRLKVGI